MRHARRKIDWFLILSMLFLIQCATDPGTSTPVAGAGIVFTQATGQVRVISSVEGTSLKSAVVLFDTNLTTGTLGEATSIEAGVTVTWPDALSFELPGCSVRPTLIESTSELTYKIFTYAYPDSCTPVASSEVAAQATVIITKNGTAATITDTTSTVGEQLFSVSASWTAPSGVTSVTVECWGGGGGGNSDANEGGGGGAYSKKTSISVIPGNSYTVHVGTGGMGNVYLGAVGGAGDDSWFSTQGTVLAKGGGLGSTDSGIGGASASGVGETRYSGGNGAIGGVSSGGGGSSAGPASNGVNAISRPGAIAPSGGGDGGGGGAADVIGTSGSSPGGGGGSGGRRANGGAGGAGQVIVSWN